MRMHSAIALLVYALAVARVTRLINSDVLLDGPRDHLVAWAWRRKYGMGQAGQRSPEGLGYRPAWETAREVGAVEPRLAYLITCPWCASIYVGAVAALLVWLAGGSPWLFVPALALAFSYVTGYLAQFGE